MKLITLICLVSWAGASRAQTVTYGDLMVADPATSEWSRKSFNVSGGYDVTNPYLNTYSLGVGGTRPLTSNFALNIEDLFFFVQPSGYNTRLEKDLKVFGVEAAHDKPLALVVFKLAYHVLAGRVNVFARTARAFRFDVRAGAGVMFMSDYRASPVASVGAGPEIRLSEKLSLGLGFDQDVQFVSGVDRVYRNRLSVSLSLVQ